MSDDDEHGGAFPATIYHVSRLLRRMVGPTGMIPLQKVFDDTAMLNAAHAAANRAPAGPSAGGPSAGGPSAGSSAGASGSDGSDGSDGSAGASGGSTNGWPGSLKRVKGLMLRMDPEKATPSLK